jgi:hypothetical protein
MYSSPFMLQEYYRRTQPREVIDVRSDVTPNGKGIDRFRMVRKPEVNPPDLVVVGKTAQLCVFGA